METSSGMAVGTRTYFELALAWMDPFLGGTTLLAPSDLKRKMEGW